MRLIIVSGLSGSGKSVALHMLEDIDFYCVDNIPAALLKAFISHTVRGLGDTYPRTAVGLDARNRPNEIETIPALVSELRRSGIGCEVLYLHASEEVLLKRYAETRRKHPLVTGDVGLREAIAQTIISQSDLMTNYVNYQTASDVADKTFFRSTPPGAVLSQFPAAGTRVPRGTRILLAIRKP
jgi:RNase adaptor protein for sRNA GlmZ degradation